MLKALASAQRAGVLLADIHAKSKLKWSSFMVESAAQPCGKEHFRRVGVMAICARDPLAWTGEFDWKKTGYRQS